MTPGGDDDDGISPSSFVHLLMGSLEDLGEKKLLVVSESVVLST